MASLDPVGGLSPTPSLALKLTAFFAGMTLGYAVLVIALSPSFHERTGIPDLIGRITLSGVRTVEGSFETRVLYEHGVSGHRAVSLDLPGELVDYGRSGGHEVALAFDSATRHMLVVLPDAGSRVLVDTAQVKSGVAISPDGATVAYAELVRPDEGAAFAGEWSFADPKRWVIKTVDVASGVVETQGIGNSPQLFTRDGVPYVLFTNSGGIRIRSLGEAAGKDIVYSTVVVGRYPARISPDGRYMALFDVEANAYGFSSVTSIDTALTLAPLARGAIDRLQRVSFSDTGAIAARLAHDGPQVGFELLTVNLASGKPSGAGLTVLTGATLPNSIVP